MNRKLTRLLNSLQAAIYEAVADSPSVAAVLSELQREGCSPSYAVDVTLPDSNVAEAPVTLYGSLSLTASDESFLRNIGIIVTSA